MNLAWSGVRVAEGGVLEERSTEGGEIESTFR